MDKARLQSLYETKIRPDLKQRLGLKNIMEAPHIKKIVVNVGLKESVDDTKATQRIVAVLAQITGQKPQLTKARKSIAGFKIREDMNIGVRVTLRRRMMYEFLDRLINLALPMVRDFQGVNDVFDRQGNYNLGIKDWYIFPEVDYSVTDRAHGMNITLHTSAETDTAAYELLKAFGMPFKAKTE
jgi:large subunit ribosomal protein L5